MGALVLAFHPDEHHPTGEAHRGLELFPDWYVKRHRPRDPADQSTALRRAFRAILGNNLAQQAVFVHRVHLAQPDGLAPQRPRRRTPSAGPSPDLVSLCATLHYGTRSNRSTGRALLGRARGRPRSARFGAFWRDFEWIASRRQQGARHLRATHAATERGYRRHAARDGLSARRLRALAPAITARLRTTRRPAPAVFTRSRPADAPREIQRRRGQRSVLCQRAETIARGGRQTAHRLADRSTRACRLHGPRGRVRLISRHFTAAIGDGRAFGVGIRWSLEASRSGRRRHRSRCRCCRGDRC
jgi:hypothetical protein